MISSAPRLNVLDELVTKASITLSSTPDSASRTISAAGPPTRTLVGSGFSVDICLAGASDTSSSGVSGIGATSGSIAAGGAPDGAFVAETTFGCSGAGSACCSRPPRPSAQVAKTAPTLKVDKIRKFIVDVTNLHLIMYLSHSLDSVASKAIHLG